MDRNVGVTHVVVEFEGDTKILGFYTLVTRTVDREVIPAKRLPSGPIGVVTDAHPVDEADSERCDGSGDFCAGCPCDR